jgi:hypothetical protein
MPFLRLTRDRRGYENTFLLHAAHPGEPPRVLYWYRSAPGVRVGRPALDEDAIRTIEEQHPDVDFDWPHILEVGAVMEPEIERRPIRQKRRTGREQPSGVKVEQRAPSGPGQEEAEELAPASPEEDLAATTEPAFSDGEMIRFENEVVEEGTPPAPRAHDLLEELVGREIATRLRARYAEVIARIHRVPLEHAQREAWEARAERLNPDNWVTPDEVLKGVQHADALFDSLRRELLAH